MVYMINAQNLFSLKTRPGLMRHASNPIIPEVDAGETKVLGHPLLHN